MSFVQGLECRECKQQYANQPTHVCDDCFGPLDIRYDYDGIKRAISRDKIAARPHNLWRYRELLPIEVAAPSPCKAQDEGLFSIHSAYFTGNF